MRLFAAADIPGAVRAPLASWGAACADDVPGLRAIPEERLHLTLVFLGSRDDAEAPGIGELVTACADGPVEVALGEPLWLSPRRPHVLTVAVGDPSGRLAELQARVSAALEAGVGHEAERRSVAPARHGGARTPGRARRAPAMSRCLGCRAPPSRWRRSRCIARTPVRRRATKRSHGLAWSSAPPGAVTSLVARVARTGKRALCEDAPPGWFVR